MESEKADFLASYKTANAEDTEKRKAEIANL